LLFSGGKDSIVMLHLALKAFRPGRLPFLVMHVDTGHNFDEVLQTRDELVEEAGVRLIVAKVQDDIDAGRVVETIPSRNPLQTVTLFKGCAYGTGPSNGEARADGVDVALYEAAGRVKARCVPPCVSVPCVRVQWAVGSGLARFRQPCIRARQRRGALAGA
jgi:Phosphoadenosine phosphosulfate reductase family